MVGGDRYLQISLEPENAGNKYIKQFSVGGKNCPWFLTKQIVHAWNDLYQTIYQSNGQGFPRESRELPPDNSSRMIPGEP
jgi:hypothetical protein